MLLSLILKSSKSVNFPNEKGILVILFLEQTKVLKLVNWPILSGKADNSFL